MRKIPIYNRGTKTLQIGLEPEGDCLPLKPGEECEFRYRVEPDVEPELEIEVEGDLLSIHCVGTKEVWQNQERIK